MSRECDGKFYVVETRIEDLSSNWQDLASSELPPLVNPLVNIRTIAANLYVGWALPTMQYI